MNLVGMEIYLKSLIKENLTNKVDLVQEISEVFKQGVEDVQREMMQMIFKYFSSHRSCHACEYKE